MSCVLLVVVLFVALSPWRAISFIVPAVTNNNRWQEVFSLSHEVDCDACDGHTNSTGRSLRILNSAPVHTSRRKFIQYTATAFTTSAAPFLLSSHAAAAGTYSDTFPISPSSTIEKKNVIAVPLGPLAPFSTTRTYRNLELSNGLKVLLVRDKNALQSSAAISIDGAGQFSEPAEVPGLAHLMEHIVLSSSRKKGGTKVLQRKARRIWKDGSNKQRLEGGGDISGDSDDEEDFEYWLEENDGDSNAFTAPGFVCFHFNVPHENLPEGLERFAQLFKLDEVENTIIDKPYVIPREIARVNDELDSTSDKSRAFYFLKQQINPEHPFSRFTAGSRETLQTIPMEKGIDLPMELLLFFRDHYIASRATLVVVSKEDVSVLDRWISPFANVMSQKVNKYQDEPLLPSPLRSTPSYPLTQSIILRSKDDIQLDENIQVLCIEWPLSLQYEKVPIGGRQAPTQNIITSASIGFVLSQIISRRGPGSLRSFLEKFGWVPNGSTKGVPRITFPVDVTGFQILRMEIGLTLDGFANRSAVVAAVFESLRTVLSRPLQLDLIKQFLSAGLLHGYLFAPRPPDAVTLAVDALRFGIGGFSGVGNDDFNWYLMPSPEDDAGIERMREAVTETLRIMTDEGKAIISFRASPKAIFEYSGGIVDTKVKTLPLFSPWVREPITGARYLIESRAIGGFSYFKSLSWFAATFDGEELSPPYLNPLVPTNIRPARPVIEKRGSWGRRFFYLEDANASQGSISRSGLKLTNEGIWRELKTNVPLEVDSNWKLWQIPPGYKDVVGIPLPLRPPEPTIECAFVFQLLSSLPAMFTTSQLALVNLWLLSFDDEILSLAELGAAAGIAYETSLNRSGLRICFRGVSQTLPSYVRRFCRRLVQHHGKLLDGTTKMAESVPSRANAIANRSPQMTRAEKDFVATYVTKVSEREVANEASFFLKCTSGAYLIAQGDILPRESLKLLSELQFIFRDYTKASNSFVVNPDLRDLTYKPVWKPKDSSPCLLPGVALISDACGRVPR
jgi:insulysin